MGFNDGRCIKCDARMGWLGVLREKPPCHKCGHKPDEKELKKLEAVEKKLRAMEDEMLKD